MMRLTESKIFEKAIGEEATMALADILERQEANSRAGLAIKEDLAKVEGTIKDLKLEWK